MEPLSIVSIWPLSKLLPAPPALLVSGINKGVNLGDDVLYSGTVSAAMEGTILGRPLDGCVTGGQEQFRFRHRGAVCGSGRRLILKHGLPDETLLNLNIPNRPFRSIKGVTVTCLSRRRFDNPIIEKIDPHGTELLLDCRDTCIVEPEQGCRP